MKNFFTFLLLGLAVAFVSCDDENTENDAKWFQPLQTTVSGTTVEVSCLTRFGDGVLGNLGIGFIYAPSGTGDSVEATNCTIEGSRMSATLSGLSAETDYTVYAFADLSAGRMLSKAAVFRTGTAGEAPDPGPDPEPDEPAFGTPSATEVTTTTATLNCGFSFDADASEYTLYFFYKDRSATSGYTRVDVSSGTGAKTAALTGLAPDTEYDFHLCADWNKKTYTSASAMFRTEKQGVEPPPASNTKYAGWAELPVEVTNSDYHYAYHICPDFRVGGHLARNYTVCFSAENHCPVWVAAPRHACYEVKGTDRTDAYGRDPIILSSIQYSSKSTGGGCNKGHMLGSAERLVTREVNKQVFYYTNIAPQYTSSFNTGGGAWNNLESFVDKQVCADTTYIVVGTYFKTFTDAYGQSCSPATISFGGRNDVTRPSMFYYLILRTKSGSTRKSVRDCRADELKCAAFVLRHNMEKGHEPQAKDMMKVSDLEELTGFRFFTNVPNAPKDTYNASDWGL